MKRLLPLNLTLLMLLLCFHASAQTLSFPAAEGFGRFAKGARGVANRQVYIVSNLNDAGAGSFREAVSVPGRIVVFSVGGIIRLVTEVNVAPNVTIAGQTAPGHGIVLAGKRVTFTGANGTIARYLRIRLGATGNSGKDASGLANGANMMFDHMSFTWGMDEVFSINWDNKGKAPDSITVQNSIIGQGLHRENHSAGGLIQTPDGGKVSLIKNLYINNKTRNPKVKGVNEFVNNVIYNYGNGNRLGDIPNYGWSGEGYIMGGSAGVSEVNIVNNYFVGGPLTPPAETTPFSRGTGTFNLFGSGNYFDNNKNGLLDGTLVPYDTLGYPGIAAAGFRASAFPYPAASPALTAAQAYQYVIDNAGVSYPRRDQVDSLLVAEATSRGVHGYYVYRETDLPFVNGGVGHVFGAPAPADTDADGMPDDWEDAQGLDKNNSQDAVLFNTTYPGYLNIEVYVNALLNIPPPVFIKPPVIMNISATSSQEPVPGSRVVIVWSDKSDNETNFILERSVNGNAYVAIDTLPANATTYTDEAGLMPNQTYFYRLKAVNTTDASVYSLAASIKTPPIPAAPALPINPVPAHQAGYIDFTNVVLKWVGSSNTERYKIYFGTDPLSLVLYADTTASTLPITGLTENTTYFWRVDALNNLGLTTGDVWFFTTAPVFVAGIAGDWRFDAAADIIVADSTLYRNDGELSNITDFSWEPGKVNNALNIKTVVPASGIVIDHRDQLFFDKHSFSFSLWVKAPAQTTASYLLHKGKFVRNASTGATGKWFGIELKDGNMRFAVDDDVTKSEVVVSHATFFTGNWTHVVVMRDAAVKKLRIYRNGVLMAEANDNTLLGIGSEDPLVVGNSNDFNVPFKGMIDELKTFNYALTETQVLELLQTTPLPLETLAPLPATGSQVDALNTVTVSWKGGVNTTVYKLYQGKSADSLGYVADKVLTDPSHTFTGLTPGTTYFWRVDAIGNQGTTTGKVWSFKTGFPQGLVGHWKLDESAGLTAADNSNYHHTAMLSNLPATGWSADGKFGTSYQFRTPVSTSAIIIPHADQLLFDANAFTISMWVKIPANIYTSGSNGDTYLIHKGTFEANTGKWYGIQLRNGVLTFAIDDGVTKTNIDVSVTSNANNLFNNQWKHIAAVRDIVARQIRLYIDGVQVGAKAYTTLTIGRALPITLGNSAENKPYRDLMDDVRLYNYALPLAAIQSLFQGSPLVSKASDPAPAHQATVNDPQHVTLSWRGNAQSYSLFGGTSPDSLALLIPGLETTTYTLPTQADHTTYYWRVDALNDGETATGDVWSFTTFDRIAPLARTKNITVQLDSAGNATVDPTDVDNGSTDAYGIATMTLSPTQFDCSNIGVNIVTFTVADHNGNVASAVDTVTIVDAMTPLAMTKDIAVTLADGIAIVTPEMINNHSYDRCGIASMTVSKSSFSCADRGINHVTLTVTDVGGNVATAKATVYVKGARAIKPLIFVTRRDHTFTGTDANTMVLGFGAQQVQLTALSMLATSFSWSPATALNNASVSNPTFTPTHAGDYNFTVTATNRYGCQETAAVLIRVMDARCGSLQQKVSMCRNTREICVSKNSVTAYLLKGYKLGSCGPDYAEAGVTMLQEEQLSIYPNPVAGTASVTFTVQPGAYELQLYDLYGKFKETLLRGEAAEAEPVTYELQGSQYTRNVYLLRLVTQHGVSTQRVVIEP